MVYIHQGIHNLILSCTTTNPMQFQKAIIHLARRHKISIANVYLPPHCSDYTSNFQNDELLLDHLQNGPASSVGISMLITVPGINRSLQIQRAWSFTTGLKHTKSLCLVHQLKPQGVTKALDSGLRMCCWSLRSWLTCCHGKQFWSSVQTTIACCLSVVRTLRWHVSIPADTLAIPKWIGFSFAIDSTTLFMQCQ